MLAPTSRGLEFLGAGYVVVQVVLAGLAVAGLWRTSRRESERTPDTEATDAAGPA